MTKFYSLLFALLMSTALLAQSPPQSFSYQTVIRDAGFNVMANQEVVLRLSILEDEPQGLMVYQEKHVETTSAIGLVNLFIGEGNISSGSFEDIDWANHTYFLQVEIDFDSDDTFIIMGTSQLRSVPYALYALNAGNTDAGSVGPQGEQGIQGATGAQGLPGTNGIDGTDGQDGTNGTNGLPGADGTNGNDGAQGETGTQGPIGDTGLQGIQGETGEQGLPGFPGINGQDGEDGIDGIDAVVDYDSLANLISVDSSFAASVSGGMGGGCDIHFPDALNNIQPITWSLSISNSYTVPSGKNLYITSTSGNGSYGIYVNGIHIHIGNEIGDENYLIFSEGDVLTNYANGTSNYLNFNGYLADENYFANCGGGGSANSASNATIDSLTQVVSNIDSALNALTSLFVFGCTDITALNYDPSANWDDGSCDYNPQVAIGDEYQGGIIFHIFEQGDLEYVEGEFHGLIAAPMDQSSASKWGCNGTNISGADGIYIGTGNQNTIDIWNNPCLAGNDAAEICYNLSLNGYDDWFLPSKDELDKLFLNLDSQGLGDLYNSYYWSSSEFSSNQAWVRNPAGLSTGYKNYSGYYVRAIRAF